MHIILMSLNLHLKFYCMNLGIALVHTDDRSELCLCWVMAGHIPIICQTAFRERVCQNQWALPTNTEILDPPYTHFWVLTWCPPRHPAYQSRGDLGPSVPRSRLFVHFSNQPAHPALQSTFSQFWPDLCLGHWILA